jgi:Uma2 family endonuclease
MSTAVAQSSKCHTPAEYLRLEEKATERHEYEAGEILAMSGGTFEHSQIAANAIRAFGNVLSGKPCHPLDSNIKVRLVERDRYVYPDVTIVCGPPEFDVEDTKRATIVNPSVVVEVLSLSTETYDRGPKFEAYRTLASLKEYVLISQWEPLVETFSRHPNGLWSISTFKGMDAVVDLPSLSIKIPLSEIYLNVVFQPRPAPPEE